MADQNSTQAGTDAPTPTTPVTQTKPTFGAWLKSLLYSVGNFFIRYPLATAATAVVVVGAVLLAVFGQKVQIGGVLGWLWGRTHPRDLPNAPAVIPPPGRIDDKGDPIPPGTPDDGGWTQAPVVLPIKDPGILSDPTTVTVTHPDGKDVTIPLPKGVKNTDVQQVIMVAPNVYQIANKDTGVDAGQILEDLNK